MKQRKVKATNINFNQERFGRFFNEDGTITVELFEEYVKEVAKYFEEKESEKEGE